MSTDCSRPYLAPHRHLHNPSSSLDGLCTHCHTDSLPPLSDRAHHICACSWLQREGRKVINFPNQFPKSFSTAAATAQVRPSNMRVVGGPLDVEGPGFYFLCAHPGPLAQLFLLHFSPERQCPGIPPSHWCLLCLFLDLGCWEKSNSHPGCGPGAPWGLCSSLIWARADSSQAEMVPWAPGGGGRPRALDRAYWCTPWPDHISPT